MIQRGNWDQIFFRYRFDRSKYAELTQKYATIFSNYLFSDTNMFSKLTQLIEHHTGSKIHYPSLDDKPFAKCTIRDLASAPLHRDWLPGECPDLESHKDLIDQFAWNIYLQLPDNGGETIVYPTSDRSIANDPNLEKAFIKPSLGDLVLFRSSNIHEVLPGTSRRLTVSGFFGPKRDGTILFWV